MFYVYAHLRKTDLSVFYIGKGSGDRAFVRSGRNAMWRSVFEKHGCMVVILERFKDEQSAFLEEARLIEAIGIKNLCNMAYGGPGSPGVEFSSERKSKARTHLITVGKPYRDMVRVIQGKRKKRIFTKCGKSFLGAPAVKAWMEKMGVTGVSTHRISAAARSGGAHKGFALRYKGVNFMKVESAVARKVGNSNGEIFESIKKAAEEMRSRGLKASSSSIHKAINGTSIHACGMRWGYVVDGKIEINDFARKTKLKKIIRSDGLVFDSLKSAAEFMGKGKSANKNISLAARGKTKTAYGFGWKYE